MFFESFDKNGIGMGRSNTQPEIMDNVFEIPEQFNDVRVRLENGVVRAETVAEYDAYIAELKAKSLVPAVVSMRQYRLALLHRSLLTPFINAVTASSNESFKIEWDYATEVSRDDVVYNAMAAQVGLDSAGLDSLFTLAGSL